MKKAKIVFIFILCICLIKSFSACASQTVHENDSIKVYPENESHENYTNYQLMNVFDVEANPLIKPAEDEHDKVAQYVANGANDFAFSLGSELIADVKNENFVFSPLAVWLPIAALVNATDEKNKSALLKTLNAEGVSEVDMNQAASRMLFDLTKTRKIGGVLQSSPVKIVNAIFVSNNDVIKMDFAQTYMDYFRGSSVNVDFSSHQAIDAVNQWVSNNTDGWITDLVQGFHPATVAAIANAIYFSDDWGLQFDPELTEEGVFKAPDGDMSAIFMLQKDTIQLYYEDDMIQALPLSFCSGGGLYIILPKSENAMDLFSSMTNDYFIEIQKNSAQAIGTLKLPPFTIENDILGLKEALTMLGVTLFDENAPALKGLTEGNTSLFLSDAIQKAVIKVDENGTTAAAGMYSGMPMDEGLCFDPTKPFEMICDKPFMFILYDLTHDGGYQVIFTGVVNQPY